MRMRVRLQFDSKQADYINNFCREIGMGVDEFCKRAVFYSINHAYNKAEQLNGKHNSLPTDAEGTDAEVRTVPDTSSAALPEQANAGALTEVDTSAV